MNIRITENQYRLIKESEEKEQLLNLINTGEMDNIELAYQIATGMGIWDEILDVYRSFLKLLGESEDTEGIYNIFNGDIDFSSGNYRFLELKQKIYELPPFLKKINGWLMLDGNTHIKSLNNLEYVENGIDALDTNLISLGNLKYVGDYFICTSAKLKDLGKLEYVGGDMNLGCNIKSLNNLKEVVGDLVISYNPIESLGDLTNVWGDLYLDGTPLSKKTTEEEIRKNVNVKGDIFL